MKNTRNILWNKLTAKIESEWSVYAKYGENLEGSRSSFAFATQLNKNILGHIGTHEGGVSNHTLHRYLKDNRFPQKVSVKILDAFAVYIGYDSFSDFENSIEDYELEDEKEDHKKQKGLWMFIGVLVGVLMLLLGFWSIKKAQNRDKIEELIHQANLLEYDAYRTLADTSVQNLNQMFLENGTALGQIKGVISRSRTNRRRLLVPPSSYTLLDFEILKTEREKLTVLTEESWLLRWYDDSLKREILYDVSNEHVYFLQREEDKWKIAADVYAGSTRVPATEKLKD